MTMPWLDTLTRLGLVDPGVRSFGFERGWVTRDDLRDYADRRMAAGDSRRAVVAVGTVDDADPPHRILDVLRGWAQEEADSAPDGDRDGERAWMFAALHSMAWSGAAPEKQLDQLEEAYAALGYPAEMRECSRYFVPRADRTIPVGRRTDSPLAAMHRLARKIGVELGVPPNELPQPYGQP